MLASILKLKCPKCRKGNLFTHSKMYRFNGFFDMPTNCTVCGQDFEIEAGFYFGAMYVSYGLTIAISVAVFAVTLVFNIYSLRNFLLLDLGVLLISLPYIFRVSRSIWISIIVKYDPSILNHKTNPGNGTSSTSN